MKNYLNDQNFVYTSRHGTTFYSERCDFKGGEVIYKLGKVTHPQLLMADAAEMMAFHAINIHPRLNGFQGYDTLRFVE